MHARSSFGTATPKSSVVELIKGWRGGAWLALLLNGRGDDFGWSVERMPDQQISSHHPSNNDGTSLITLVVLRLANQEVLLVLLSGWRPCFVLATAFRVGTTPPPARKERKKNRR